MYTSDARRTTSDRDRVVPLVSLKRTSAAKNRRARRGHVSRSAHHRGAVVARWLTRLHTSNLGTVTPLLARRDTLQSHSRFRSNSRRPFALHASRRFFFARPTDRPPILRSRGTARRSPRARRHPVLIRGPSSLLYEITNAMAGKGAALVEILVFSPLLRRSFISYKKR